MSQAPAPGSLGKTWGILRKPDFLYLWIGQLLSQTALNATIYILLVRVGRELRRKAKGPGCERLNNNTWLAGLHPDCLPWLHERKIAMLGSDGGNDVLPSLFKMRSPIHAGALVYMGMHLLDNAALEELAPGRYAGMLESLGRITGLTLKALKPAVPAPEGPMTAPLAQIFPPATVLVLLGDQLSTAYQAAQLALRRMVTGASQIVHSATV